MKFICRIKLEMLDAEKNLAIGKHKTQGQKNQWMNNFAN